MSLRFDRYRDRDDDRHKPPPNYFSRRMQYRLMLLVTMLLLVVLIMDRARDPQIYRNFFRAVGAPLNEGQPASRSAEELSGTTDDEGMPAQTERPINLQSPIFINNTAAAPSLETATDPVARARREGWRRVLASLVEDDQQALRTTIDAVLFDEPIDAAQRDKWNDLMLLVDAAWNKYLRDASQSVDAPDNELSSDDKQAWLDVLAGAKLDWEESLKPTLATVDSGQPLDDQQRARLFAIRHELLELAIGEVRDNMMLRPAEADAWFSLLNILDHADEAAIRKRSDGTVGYLELYKQPEAYRGRLVTIHGEARMAYHVRAPENPYGLTGYYVFTIKPADGSRSPIIVYALELPAGFPKIKDRDVDRGTTELNEDVEFTGYVFKRWVYRSRGGIDTAPLLLAKSPRWRPNPASFATQEELPSVTFLVSAVLFALLVGVLIAVWVYRQSRRDTDDIATARASRRGRREPEVARLSDTDVADAGRQLRELAEHEERSA